eukprot:TRINITY_DN6743_c0_g1_i1.p1 TRINITY_DN6743_c0_g1~~TRINITY_DN6743_c0_g1_i1.p1  ORF type:complete len:269 (+),score=35.19 TRINITY_DN6743_c0_g1_i1:15-821(+)
MKQPKSALISKQPAEEQKNDMRMILEVLEGPVLSPGTQFIITSKGYENSKRKKKDGFVYIGTKDLNEKTGEIENDILISKREEGMGDIHCVIQYVESIKSFCIHDTGQGTGTFLKIQKAKELKHSNLLSFGECSMVFGTDVEGNVKIHFLDGPRSEESFIFKKDETNIKIGRNPDCQIIFYGGGVSRCQCCISKRSNKYYIEDGYNNTPSTNGTWLLLDDRTPLDDGNVIKAGQTLFSVKIVAPQGRLKQFARLETGAIVRNLSLIHI